MAIAMAGETDLIGMLVANPPAFYGISLLMIFILGSLLFFGARKG